jgi:hypothetical protein
MRTNLLRDFVANGGRVGEAIADRFSAAITADKAGENPVRGVRACFRVSSFNAAGVGSCRLVTGDTGADYLGDRFKRPAVKSSTMKGAIEYVRERLPVRL